MKRERKAPLFVLGTDYYCDLCTGPAGLAVTVTPPADLAFELEGGNIRICKACSDGIAKAFASRKRKPKK